MAYNRNIQFVRAKTFRLVNKNPQKAGKKGLNY